jgi:hypothetical protein
MEDVISKNVECYVWFYYAGGARFKLFPEQAVYKNTALPYAMSFSN